MKLPKFFLVVILILFSITSANANLKDRRTFYSIQLVTFNSKNRACKFLSHLPGPIKGESFVYKTDNGRYTVRIWTVDNLELLRKRVKTLETFGIKKFIFVRSYLNRITLNHNKSYSANTLSSKYTFKELNLLSTDMILKGTNPAYDFYIPVYNSLTKARVYLNIKAPDYLRKDSLIQILVNDVPIRSLKAKGLNTIVSFDLVPRRNEKVIKVSVRGNLRISHNICEDVFSGKTYMVISKDSQIVFFYRPYHDISSFIREYKNHFCLHQLEAIPLAYYLSLINPIPSRFYWKSNNLKMDKRNGSCKDIIVGNETRLENSTLFLSPKSLYGLEKGYYPLFFGKSLKLERISEPETRRENILTLRELGFKTTSIKGALSLSYSIPFSLAQIGGLPDTLYLRLKFAHTPLYQNDRPELRVYLNNVLIKSQSLEGFGIKQVDVKIPTNLLSYGYNFVNVNLVSSPSSDKCLGDVPSSVLTVFDDSYFYWNSIERNPQTISDFLKMLNGRVLLNVRNQNLIPIAVKLLNQLARVNKGIKYIGINDNKQNYDFIITLSKPENNTFKICNPLTNKVIYQARYQKPFIFFMLKSSKVPQLIISQYGNPDINAINHDYNMEDYLNLFGNVGIFSKDYMTAFEVGKKLRIKYENVKGIGYYWNTYRLIVIIFLSLLMLVFLLYVYKKLTRRPE